MSEKLNAMERMGQVAGTVLAHRRFFTKGRAHWYREGGRACSTSLLREME
jgi:hypothetical protein